MMGLVKYVSRWKAVLQCLLGCGVFLLGYLSSQHLTVNSMGSQPSEDLSTPNKDFVLLSQTNLLHSRAVRWSSDLAFHKYLTSLDVTCKKSRRVGKVGDGGWDVCLSGPYQLKPPCLVYSFGIRYDFSFDDGIDHKFHCIVKAFDPSMKKVRNHKRGNQIHFFKEGIDEKSYIRKTIKKGDWQMHSLSTILKKQGDTNKIIDYLKMDVEKSEWVALPDMAVKGLLKNIKQIGIEIHRYKGTVNATHLINILEDHGFRKWKMHYNPVCQYTIQGTSIETSKCIELYYINTNFIDKDSVDSFLTL